VGLSYADAVRLMGGGDSRAVATLDRLTGGLLLAASAAGAGFAVSLFEAKGELARLSTELVRGLGQQLRGLDRFSRSERLAAAHSVLVLTAYFDVLVGADLPFDIGELQLTRAEQAALATGQALGPNQLGALAAGLLRAEVPMPSPQRPYEVTIEVIRAFYGNLSAALLRFVSGLVVWDSLDETGRERFTATLSQQVPGWAVARYEELFRELAVEFPEVAFWANLVNHQATREQVRRLGTGMVGLEQILANLAVGRVPDDRRRGLCRAYRAALRRPVLTTGDGPEGLLLPLLGDAYVNPDFRVAEVTQRFAEESWWDEQPIRDDLEGFLAGYLTAPQAVMAPLLVLGQPGSGKSVLTQVLAARLPPTEFLVVRVVLREVAADADLQAQIEHAIRSATGESMAWPDLARSAGDALPVVLIDGFDELLQATGVSQTDYLLKVEAFQAREADQGRPTAVLVTSRTAVADRAQPVSGMVVIRLEPFREAQISQWLRVWNEANTAGLAARGLQPPTPQTLLAHAELASQPLLLLMLALYDADANRLQRADAGLGEAELYERLLTSFAEREIHKTGAALPDEQFEEAVERELLRLSIVAFAMFSRGRQWVSEAELDVDLPALIGPPGSQPLPDGLRAPLTAAQVIAGRFFFIHEAQATRDNTQLRTYEFLHATFGEYLMARLVTRELSDLTDAARLSLGRARPIVVEDAFLYALLSFMPLTMRATIVSFLAGQLQALPEPRRQQLCTVLLGLFRDSLGPRRDTRYGDYTPLRLPVPARHAAYSANIAVLAVLSSGEVTGRRLFSTARDPVGDWRNIALLWRSQLPSEGWAGLIKAINLDRTWDGGRRDFVLRPGETTWESPRGPDPYWTYNRGPEDADRRRGLPFGFARHINDSWLRAQARLLCDADDDTLIHALAPLAGDLSHAISIFHCHWPEQGRAVSAANALITLWLTSNMDSAADALTAAYDTCLEIAILGRFSPSGTTTRESFRILVFRQLAADESRLPQDWLKAVVIRIQDAVSKRPDEVRGPEELLRIANATLPGLMASTRPQLRPPT
jgi:hypothetical protein